MLYTIGNLLCYFDELLDSKRKRHILGGSLISLSALFGGLGVTVMTITKEGDNRYE